MPDKMDDNYGYVYCLYNKYMPNICKIGYTYKTSHDRAKELSSRTNCPVPFDVIFDIKVRNPQKYEKIIHRKLKKFRINSKREFFECTPKDIITLFDKNNLIKFNDELCYFPDNYLTIYKKDIIIKNKNIETDNNIKYIRIYNLSDIFYLFIILFNIFISLFYYVYICIKYLVRIVSKN